MTAYFDKLAAALHDIRARGAANDIKALEDLMHLEHRMVFDVRIASMMPAFPEKLRTRIDEAILKYGVESQPRQVKGWVGNDFEHNHQHVTSIGCLVESFHDIFHEVALRQLPRLSDDPRTPLHCLFADAETKTEEMAQRLLTEGKDRI